MGQEQSNTTTAPTATTTVPNVLARDYAGVAVTVHCVEVSNENVQKLQALLASGAPAAELEAALPSERFSGAASSTIADVRAFLEARNKHQVTVAPMSAAERQYYGMSEGEEAAAAAVSTTPETMTAPLFLYALQKGSKGETKPALLHEATHLQEVLDQAQVLIPAVPGCEGRSLYLLYSKEEQTQGFEEICCCIAICAALCACLVGVCCCVAASKKNNASSKPNNSNNNNNNNNNYNYDNGQTYNQGNNNNPLYSDQQQQQQYNGQQQQYGGQQQQQQYYQQPQQQQQQPQGVPNSYGVPPQQAPQQGQAAQPAYYNYAANPL